MSTALMLVLAVRVYLCAWGSSLSWGSNLRHIRSRRGPAKRFSSNVPRLAETSYAGFPDGGAWV